MSDWLVAASAAALLGGVAGAGAALAAFGGRPVVGGVRSAVDGR
ncbi:hypothetical protein [Candidatus Halobonum tyrrellensis]|nr:hypothetical protein [Candidatus Halobonum tyrrellensis]